MTPAEQGDPNSRLLILAEAPGKTEIRMGMPLCGPSGDILDEGLKHNKIRRTDCYILNVWPYLIRKDANENFFRPDGAMVWGNKTGFTDVGLEDAADTIERIHMSGANCILTLGQQAMALATDQKTAVLKHRGSIYEGVDRVDGRKTVGTMHPSYILRGNYVSRYTMYADMKRAWEEAQTPTLNLPFRSIHIRPSLDEVLHFIADCRDAGIVATDLEVINHQVACFSLCYDPSEAMTVPLMDETYGHYWSIDDELRIWEAYAGLMGDESVVKVNQNLIGFDAPFLTLQNRIRVRGRLEDTMIAQHIMYPEFPKGLDYICSIHTREPYYKDEGKIWKNAGGDWPQFWRYCAKDAIVALEAWHVLEAEMDAGGFRETYEMTLRLSDPLLYMTIAGLAVDKDKLAVAREVVGQELEAKKEELRQIADFNPLSSQQCMKYFYGQKGITPYLSTQTGRPTADDKAMARIFRRFNLREAKLTQEIRKLSKLKNTYIEVAIDPDGRLRCSWNARGTWTGRLSSSQTIFGTGMNLQNLDPMFKGFIVADPDDAQSN